MKKKLIVIGVILLIAVGAIGLLHKRKAALAKAAPPAVLPVVVDAVTLQPQKVTLTLPAMGVVSSDLSTTLSTRVSGRVLKVFKREGDAVRKGELLLQIDARDLQARKESLRLKRQSLAFDIAAKKENLKALATALKNAIALPCPDQGAARRQGSLDRAVRPGRDRHRPAQGPEAERRKRDRHAALERQGTAAERTRDRHPAELHADRLADRRHPQRPDGVGGRPGRARQAAAEDLRDRWALSGRQPAGLDPCGEHSARRQTASP